MRNFRIAFLIVGCLFAFGIYGLVHIPKQEFPEYTIRQGVVVGVYPGATSEEVEQQLAKPLEQFLMTYKEVKRSKTTSTSQNGMCYVMVELEDHVNDKDEVWSKIKHGLVAFKSQLPPGVAAVVTNDDFGDTSAPRTERLHGRPERPPAPHRVGLEPAPVRRAAGANLDLRRP